MKRFFLTCTLILSALLVFAQSSYRTTYDSYGRPINPDGSLIHPPSESSVISFVAGNNSLGTLQGYNILNYRNEPLGQYSSQTNSFSIVGTGCIGYFKGGEIYSCNGQLLYTVNSNGISDSRGYMLYKINGNTLYYQNNAIVTISQLTMVSVAAFLLVIHPPN